MALIPLSRGDMLKALYLENFIPIGSALVRRVCFDSLGLLDERIKGGRRRLRILSPGAFKSTGLDTSMKC